MSIPVEPRENLMLDVLPIVLVGTDTLPFPVTSIEGTGFVLADGMLATCWHCIEASPPQKQMYGASRLRIGDHPRLSPIGFRERLAHDLGWARINYRPELGITIATKAPQMGDSVWTFGYPLTDVRIVPGGGRQFTANPRLLRGHILRPFVFEHPTFGSIPSWELSFSVPVGLSGAPLFLEGTLQVAGVLYGNNDVATVEESAQVDVGSGTRTPEVQRIVSFGLAHHWQSLQVFNTIASEKRDGPFAD